MKVLVDLNVILDVVQSREQHYAASAAVLGRVADGRLQAAVPAHALTTLHYLVKRHGSKCRADELIEWLVDTFEIVPASRDTFLRARALRLRDFEDAVVAVSAAQAGCEAVVSRNVADFEDSLIPALTPLELLAATASDEGQGAD